MTNELVDWYRAQLAEDERRAQRVQQAYADEEKFWAPAVVINAGALVAPADVLRDVAAKRAIVDAWQKHEDELRDLDSAQEFGFRQGLEFALRHLASAFADRPGYREEWKP